MRGKINFDCGHYQTHTHTHIYKLGERKILQVPTDQGEINEYW